MTITLIAAVARNLVIGDAGGLPWHIPGDLPRLKRLTMGHVLVMGRKTFDSIGRPLPGRTTIVVTRQPGWHADGVEVAHTIPAALECAARLGDQVFVMGGGEIYTQALDVADRMELTEVDAAPQGDTHFPPVDWSRWHEVAREQHDGYAFATFDRA